MPSTLGVKDLTDDGNANEKESGPTYDILYVDRGESSDTFPSSSDDGSIGVPTGNASGAGAKSLLCRFILFAVAFALAESALVASVSLSSRILGGAGSISVSALYLTYAFGTLFTNRIVAASGGGRLRPALICGQLGLVPFHVACLFAAVHDWAGADGGLGGSDGGVEDDVITQATAPDVGGTAANVNVSPAGALFLVVSAAISGICAGVAWAAAGAFTTNTALALAQMHEPSPEDVSLGVASTAARAEGGESEIQDSGSFAAVDDSGVAGGNFSMNGFRDGFGFLAAISRLVSLFLRTDFHALAGNLSGLFNVVLLLFFLGGHIFTSYSLRMDDYIHVRNTYVDLLLVAMAGSVIMICCVKDPVVPLSHGERSAASAVEDVSSTTNCESEGDGEVGGGGADDDRDGVSTWNEGDPRSVLFPLRLTFHNPHLRALAGTHLASGFMEGLVLCYVGGTLVAEPSHIGLLSSVKSISSAVAAPVFALLGNSDGFGRIKVLLVGGVAYLVSLLLTTTESARVARLVSTDEVVTSAAVHTDGGDELAVLAPLYVLAGVGFSTWQGTAGGALLSEVAASIDCNANGVVSANGCGNSNLVLTAVFSGCKVLSGAATAAGFFIFSNPNVPILATISVCFSIVIIGMIQLLFGSRSGLWDVAAFDTARRNTRRANNRRFWYGSVENAMPRGTRHMCQKETEGPSGSVDASNRHQHCLEMS